MFKQVFESVAEAIVVSDSKGNIVSVNPRASDLLGYSMEEFTSMRIEDLVPEEYRSGHSEKRAEYYKSPKARVMGSGRELSAKLKDGSYLAVEISLNTFRHDGDMYAIALITDLAETKKISKKLSQLNQELEQGVARRTRELNKAVQALKESQQLYVSMARNFPNGTINVFDRDLKYIFVEGQELFKFGISSKMLIGTSYIERLSPKIAPRIEEELKKVLSGEEVTFEIDHNAENYVLNAVPLYDSQGLVNQILLVEKNITEQKKSEKEIMRSLEKERQLNELKSRFVSMASHEFRTPLGTILSSISLVERYQENGDVEKGNKHIQRIKNSVQTLTGILNDFLSLDKLEQGKVELRSEKFNIRELAEELCDELRTSARKELDLTFEHDGPDMVRLDPQFTRIIMLNLMSNAIKYSKQSGKVYLGIHVNHHIELMVKDDGIGIPEQDQQHLFERFFRAQNVTNIQGTGLGLNIVKRYVDMMGGNITFESSEGQGTSFKVRLEQQPLKLQ